MRLLSFKESVLKYQISTLLAPTPNLPVFTVRRNDTHLLPKLLLQVPCETGMFTLVQKRVNSSGGDVSSLGHALGDLGASRLSEG